MFKMQKKQQKKAVAKKPVAKTAKKAAAKKPVRQAKRTMNTSAPLSAKLSQPQLQQSTTLKAVLSSVPMTKPARFSFSKKSTSPLTQAKRFGGWGYSHFTPEADVEQRIMALLREIPAVNQDRLTPTAHFQFDLGLDSLQQVELVMMLEDQFKVEINDDDAGLITRVDHAIHYFSHTPYTV